jgi:hypothetical protein
MMRVAIPSHHRSQTIEKHALQFVLSVLKVDPKDVYVFVSDADQLKEYQLRIGGHGVNLVNANTATARDKFNFVHCYFENGTDVLVVEDDVSGLVSRNDLPHIEVVKAGFRLMREEGKSLWGIYPSANKFFMRDSASVGFVFVVANVYGFIADDSKELLISEQSKTDYERSILYYKHRGGAVRLNYAAAKTNNYTNKGGLQLLPNRAKVEATACLNLLRRFPRLVSIKNGSKSKFMEIKLLAK